MALPFRPDASMPSPPAPRPEGLRSFVGLGVAALAGLLLGLALVTGAARDDTRSDRALQLYGRPLPARADAADVALEWANQRFDGWFNLNLPDGEQRAVRYAALGVKPDRQRLRQLIRAAQSGVGPAPARADADAPPAVARLIVPVQIQRERLLDTLLELKDELDRSAIDARLDLDHQAVIDENAGRLLDVDQSSLSIERALELGADVATLTFEARAPRRFAHELADIRHDALLGSFETRYGATPRSSDPSFNLQLAASKLDGYVLMPGAELDFNAVVGPQDEAHGYRISREETDVDLIDTIPGGTSQISGTLHAAALFAGLDVVERHPLAQPSPYIELGLDAAVAPPSLNLRLKNPYDFPIVLSEKVAAGRVRAEIRGARRPHTITLLRKIDAAVPFERLERTDGSLARGVRFVAQRGVPGIRLHRYRIRRDGAHAVREVMFEERAPLPEVTLVGTGANSDDGSISSRENTTVLLAHALAFGRPPHEPASDHLADELLVMTEDGKLDGPFVEQRVPGHFAGLGSTKNIGAPARISPP